LTSHGVLLALLDSNPTRVGWRKYVPELATGLVDPDHLTTLGRLLASHEDAHIARIAVLHHHPLPIAFNTAGVDSLLAPTVILRNAGTCLRILADRHFDIILHGHDHKQQLARLDLASIGENSYPMSVLAAGSAAKVGATSDNNSLNLITIDPDGAIDVEVRHYGGGQSATDPAAVQRLSGYRESAASCRQRLFVRALLRHGIACDIRTASYVINESGDLFTEHTISNFQVLDRGLQISRQPFLIFRTVRGRRAGGPPVLDNASMDSGIRLEPDRGAEDSGVGPELDRETRTELFHLTFPNAITSNTKNGVSYSISHASTNCVMMSKWEADQFSKSPPFPGWENDHDGLGMIIVYPYRSIKIMVKFPREMKTVQPSIYNAKLPNIIHNELNEFRWIEGMVPGNLVMAPDAGGNLGADLSYNAETLTWTLAVEKPPVGHVFFLRWQVPDEPTNPRIQGKAEAQRRGILLAADTWREEAPVSPKTEQVESAWRRFEAFRDEIKRRWVSSTGVEKWLIVLHVYDDDERCLRPAFSWCSWTGKAVDREFQLELGEGVAGAAFLQRRLAIWRDRRDPGILIEPKEMDGIAHRFVVGIPICHKSEDWVRRPPPGTMLGVVAVASDSPASGIIELHPSEDSSDARAKELIKVATGVVEQMIGDLGLK
jgi:hypothetical protein